MSRITLGRRWQNFLTSQRGRTTLQVAFVGTSVGTGLLYALPQTYGLSYLRNFFQLYFQGKPLAPTKEFMDLVAEVYDDVGVDVAAAKNIRWFTCVGFDPLTNGTTMTYSGALIGVPKSFSYKNVDDIDRSDIRLHMTETIPWQSTEGRALANSLVLSDEAKRFAIARECQLAMSLSPMYRACIVSLMTCAYFVVNKYAKNFLKMQQRPTRFFLYGFNGAVFAFVTTLVMDWMNCAYEQYSDKNVADLGGTYLRGGYEYYAKHLQRNRVLRVLLKEQGMAFYSAEGNVNVIWRQPHLPLTSRRNYFYKRLYGDDKDAKEASPPAVADAETLASPPSSRGGANHLLADSQQNKLAF